MPTVGKPDWFDRDIIQDPVREVDIEALKRVQRVLHCEPTGTMDDITRMHIRGMQKMFRLRVHGAVDQATAEVIDKLRPGGSFGEDTE